MNGEGSAQGQVEGGDLRWLAGHEVGEGQETGVGVLHSVPGNKNRADTVSGPFEVDRPSQQEKHHITRF